MIITRSTSGLQWMIDTYLGIPGPGISLGPPLSFLAGTPPDAEQVQVQTSSCHTPSSRHKSIRLPASMQQEPRQIKSKQISYCTLQHDRSVPSEEELYSTVRFGTVGTYTCISHSPLLLYNLVGPPSQPTRYGYRRNAVARRDPQTEKGTSTSQPTPDMRISHAGMILGTETSHFPVETMKLSYR